MNWKKPAAFVALILAFCLSLSAAPAAALALEDTLLTPAGRHLIMGQAKAERLSQSRAALKSLAPVFLDQTNYDVTYYRIDLAVDVMTETIYGEVTVAARSLVDGLDTVGLDFDATLDVDSVYNAAGDLDYNHSGYRIDVALDRAYSRDSLFEVTIKYHGHPVTGGFQGFAFDWRDGNPVISTLSQPFYARTWWPCKDRPDDKADSLDIFITCDTSLFCASNGKLIDTTRLGDGTWRFAYQVRYPIAAYLFSLAISNYTVWRDWYHYHPDDSMEIVHHVYPDQYSYSLSHYNITPYAIGVFADLFGEYPYINEKYGHANFEWGGGMEHQTVTSMSGGSFGFSEPVVVHELAHQWWGDMITCRDWHHIWLNEGFASYCEALYYEVKNGSAAYHTYMNGMKYQGGGSIYIQDTTSVGNIFGSIVYDKGAWVLHMLRHIIGDSVFFATMRDLADSEYRFKNITTTQFKNFVESRSGKELDYFFEEWIYGTYFPEYDWSYYSEPDLSDGTYWVYLPLRQTQDSLPLVFKMPLDIRFTHGSHSDTSKIVLFNDLRSGFYFLKTDRPVTDVNLDPGNWILKTSTKTGWTYRLIPFPLDIASQYTPYQDTAIARGGTGTGRFTVISGVLPPGIQLDSLTGLISGVPTQDGSYSFQIRARDLYLSNYRDSLEYNLTVTAAPGLPGDVNSNEIVNIQDITYLLNFLYRSGPPPDNLNLADPDRSCLINIQDITHLINYLYRSGPALLMGCAST